MKDGMIISLEILNFIIKDSFFFWSVQGLLIVLVILGIIKELTNKSNGRVVSRGKKSNQLLYIAYGVISVAIFQFINVSQEGNGYKVFITFFDLLLVFYLCFFNSWSRNKIIGIYVKFERKIENL